MAAVKVGIVMFVIPFVFAFYPELLLIEQAQFAQSLDGGVSVNKIFLKGYDGTIDPVGLGWLLIRLVVSLYLVATALTRYDASSLSLLGSIIRIVLAILILLKIQFIAIATLLISVIYLLFHQFKFFKSNQ